MQAPTPAKHQANAATPRHAGITWRGHKPRLHINQNGAAIERRWTSKASRPTPTHILPTTRGSWPTSELIIPRTSPRARAAVHAKFRGSKKGKRHRPWAVLSPQDGTTPSAPKAAINQKQGMTNRTRTRGYGKRGQVSSGHNTLNTRQHYESKPSTK